LISPEKPRNSAVFRGWLCTLDLHRRLGITSWTGQPELSRFWALQVHRPGPVHPYRERDVVGIDPVGLDRRGAHGCFHMPAIDADHRQTRRDQVSRSQGANGPASMPICSKASPIATRNTAMASGSLAALPSRTPRRWSSAIDRGLFYSDAEFDIMLHGCSPQAADARSHDQRRRPRAIVSAMPELGTGVKPGSNCGCAIAIGKNHPTKAIVNMRIASWIQPESLPEWSTSDDNGSQTPIPALLE